MRFKRILSFKFVLTVITRVVLIQIVSFTPMTAKGQSSQAFAKPRIDWIPAFAGMTLAGRLKVFAFGECKQLLRLFFGA